MFNKIKRLQSVAIVVVLLLFGRNKANAQVVLGPFVPGTGTWDVVPNGGFETGNVSGWSDAAPALGTFRASRDFAAAGAFSAKAQTIQAFNGSGYALSQNLPVQGGQQYVLSGFFNTAGLTTGRLFLDLNDVAFEREVQSLPSMSEWQFAWAIINVPSGTTSVRVRLVRDGDVRMGEFGYIDEVALTPIARFQRPESAAQVIITDAISREVSVYMPERPIAISDAISREISLLAYDGPHPLFTDAVSREISVLAYDGPYPLFTDAISREVSIFQPFVHVELTDAISREVSIFSVIPIDLGTPYAGTLGVRSQLYFRHETPPDLTVRIVLDHASPTAWTELYASFNKLPDDATAEFASSNPSQPDQELIIPNTQDGTYFILARTSAESNPSASKGFTVLAQSLAFGLRSVDPSVIGAGTATIEISGARFTANTAFALRDPDSGDSYTPLSTELVDPATALVTFNMAGARTGHYDVVATEPALPGPPPLSRALEIAPATDERFLNVRLELPATIRGGRPTDGTVYVTNTGNVDIPIVELSVFTPNDPRVELSSPDVEDAIAQPGGTNANMGFSVLALDLRPGETRLLNVVVTARPDYPAHGSLLAGAFAVPSTMAQFRDGPLYQVSERIRLAIAGDAELPEEVRAVALDATAWWDGVRSYFDENGFSGLQRTTANGRLPWWLEKRVCPYACNVVAAAAVGLCQSRGGPPLACVALGIAVSAECGLACEWCLEYPVACRDVLICIGPGFGLGGLVGVIICFEVIQSWDPNEKTGLDGFGAEQFLKASDTDFFHIAFENLPEATAPAAEVKITDSLHASLDLASLRLGRIRFGETTVDVPLDRVCYHTVVNMVAEHGVLVDVNVCVNAATRQVVWDLRALDPQTLQLPGDPTLGFLPPNDETGRGEGYVEFTIKPVQSTPTGTVVTNRASIVFDYNEPVIACAPGQESDPDCVGWSNMIDSGAPQSAVQTLPAQRATPFVVRWSGQDDAGGSGVAAVEVFVKTDTGPFQRWNGSTEPADWAYFNGEVGKTYSFYAVGRDNVGNIEAEPATPDATTIVTAARHPGDVDYDGDADLVDHQLFTQCYGAPPNATIGGPDSDVASGCAEADLNTDGRVDLLDFAELQNGFTGTPPP